MTLWGFNNFSSSIEQTQYIKVWAVDCVQPGESLILIQFSVLDLWRIL